MHHRKIWAQVAQGTTASTEMEKLSHTMSSATYHKTPSLLSIFMLIFHFYPYLKVPQSLHRFSSCRINAPTALIKDRVFPTIHSLQMIQETLWMPQLKSTPAPRRPSQAGSHRCTSCYSLGVSRAFEERSQARSSERQSTFFLFEDGGKALSKTAAAPGLQITSQPELFDKARHTSLQCDSISCEPHLHKQAKPGVLIQNKVLISWVFFL